MDKNEKKNAHVLGNVCTYGDACVLGNSRAFLDARVCGYARIFVDARISQYKYYAFAEIAIKKENNNGKKI